MSGVRTDVTDYGRARTIASHFRFSMFHAVIDDAASIFSDFTLIRLFFTVIIDVDMLSLTKHKCYNSEPPFK